MNGKSGLGGAKLNLESLESREVPAAYTNLVNGVLEVVGDGGHNSATVNPAGSQVQVRITTTGSSQVVTQSFNRSEVREIRFWGNDGNDRFVSNVNIPSMAWGGNGNDYLEGANAVDVFSGGNGNDTLVGYGGNDRLYGDAGNDWLYGMSGNDLLVGSTGNDVLYGMSGNDLLFGGTGLDRLDGGSGTDSAWISSRNDRTTSTERVWVGTINIAPPYHQPVTSTSSSLPSIVSGNHSGSGSGYRVWLDI